jgi:hypothetical protein
VSGTVVVVVVVGRTVVVVVVVGGSVVVVVVGGNVVDVVVVDGVVAVKTQSTTRFLATQHSRFGRPYATFVGA